MKTRVIWTKNEVFGHVPELPLLKELAMDVVLEVPGGVPGTHS